MTTCTAPPLLNPAEAIIPPAQQLTKREMERRVAALKCMSGSELRNEYRRLFGMECYSHNYAVLRGRCRWKLYTMCYGRLSTAALRYAQTLSDLTRLRERQPVVSGSVRTVRKSQPITHEETDEPQTVGEYLSRAGRAVQKEYKGQTHTVYSTSEGPLLYEGKEYKSITAVAKLITGYKCSGNEFFKDATRITTV